jgi:hypothetical protein
VTGYATPEAAVRTEDLVPPQFARVVAVDYSPNKNHAVVLLEYNEPPTVEPYVVFCENTPSGWVEPKAVREVDSRGWQRAPTEYRALRLRGADRRRCGGTSRYRTNLSQRLRPIAGKGGGCRFHLQRVAAALSRMQERRGLRLGAGRHLQLVRCGRLSNPDPDPRAAARLAHAPRGAFRPAAYVAGFAPASLVAAALLATTPQ